MNLCDSGKRAGSQVGGALHESKRVILTLVEIDSVQCRMEEDWPSGTWIEERDVEFQSFKSAFAVDVKGDRRWRVGVQQFVQGTQLDLNSAITRESAAPDHYPKLFW